MPEVSSVNNQQPLFSISTHVALGAIGLVASAVAFFFASHSPTVMGQALMAGCFATPIALASAISLFRAYLQHKGINKAPIEYFDQLIDKHFSSSNEKIKMAAIYFAGVAAFLSMLGLHNLLKIDTPSTIILSSSTYIFGMIGLVYVRNICRDQNKERELQPMNQAAAPTKS